MIIENAKRILDKVVDDVFFTYSLFDNKTDAFYELCRLGFNSVDLIRDFNISKDEVLKYMPDHKILRVSNILFLRDKKITNSKDLKLPTEYFIDVAEIVIDDEVGSHFDTDDIKRKVEEMSNHHIFAADISCVSILDYLLENDGKSPCILAIKNTEEFQVTDRQTGHIAVFSEYPKANQFQLAIAYDFGDEYELQNIKKKM